MKPHQRREIGVDEMAVVPDARASTKEGFALHDEGVVNDVVVDTIVPLERIMEGHFVLLERFVRAAQGLERLDDLDWINGHDEVPAFLNCILLGGAEGFGGGEDNTRW
jgi:hypothetical protein